MILYASKYGTSRQVALWLAESLHLQAFDLQSLPKNSPFSLPEDAQDPILVLPLYAGGLYLARQALQSLRSQTVRRLILVTVGLSNPERPDTREAIRAAADRTFADFDVTIFSTRGGIDYSRLSKKDSILMWMLKKAVEKNPESGENQKILDTYGQKVSLLDQRQVHRIARQIQSEAGSETPVLSNPHQQDG